MITSSDSLIGMNVRFWAKLLDMITWQCIEIQPQLFFTFTGAMKTQFA